MQRFCSSFSAFRTIAHDIRFSIVCNCETVYCFRKIPEAFSRSVVAILAFFFVIYVKKQLFCMNIT